MERSFQYDVHSNASTVLGNITLGLPLFKVHGCRPAEIIAILTHELGHYKLNHLTKNTIVDTAYMLVFGLIMTFLINDASFLRNFGFYKQSYFISFYLFIYIYLYSIDVPIRMAIRVLSRVFEYEADAYTVEQGYGYPLRDSLIRCSAKSLDTLFTSFIDHIMTSNHPTMQERLDAIEKILEEKPELKDIAK